MTDAVTLLSAAVAALAGVVVYLFRENRSLQKQLVEVYRGRDEQRDEDAQTWRQAVEHMEAIRDHLTRREGRP